VSKKEYEMEWVNVPFKLSNKEEKNQYSIGRVISKHIPAHHLSADWFDNWEKNDNL